MREYWFWQRSVSPHMAGLARAVAARGVRVTYVASEVITAERARQGWSAPETCGVRLELLDSPRAVALAKAAPPEAVHFTEGLARGGVVADATQALRARRAAWGVMMETVDDRGLPGLLKRIDYRRRLTHARPDFLLAIGARTSGWVAARGVAPDRIFPFTYFLPRRSESADPGRPNGEFRIGFVGQLIPRKRVDLLIEALGSLAARRWSLVVVGGGPSEPALRALADVRLPGDRVRWAGQMPMARSLEEISRLDCLVLPSAHDGWGAVVTEALMAGVPTICSDACGASVAVLASKAGGVFPSGSTRALAALLGQVIAQGSPDAGRRRALATWARCLSSDAGAAYVEAVLGATYDGLARPGAPWESAAPVPRERRGASPAHEESGPPHE